jgi:chromosome segregation ATPase
VCFRFPAQLIKLSAFVDLVDETGHGSSEAPEQLTAEFEKALKEIKALRRERDAFAHNAYVFKHRYSECWRLGQQQERKSTRVSAQLAAAQQQLATVQQQLAAANQEVGTAQQQRISALLEKDSWQEKAIDYRQDYESTLYQLEQEKANSAAAAAQAEAQYQATLQEARDLEYHSAGHQQEITQLQQAHQQLQQEHEQLELKYVQECEEHESTYNRKRYAEELERKRCVVIHNLEYRVVELISQVRDTQAQRDQEIANSAHLQAQRDQEIANSAHLQAQLDSTEADLQDALQEIADLQAQLQPAEEPGTP